MSTMQFDISAVRPDLLKLNLSELKAAYEIWSKKRKTVQDKTDHYQGIYYLASFLFYLLI